MSMIIDGKITISRTISNREDDYISIQIHDERAGVQFVTGRMTLADFASAVTGLGSRDIELDVSGLQNVGKVREFKTVKVPYRPKALRGEAEEEDIRSALSSFEVDGWTGRTSDLKNWHQSTNDGHYMVHFERWVEREEGA